MQSPDWNKYQAAVKTEDCHFFFDVNEGKEGLRLVVTQSYPSGQRTRISIKKGDVSAVLSELLKAVSSMADQEPPPQFSSDRLSEIRKKYPRAYLPWSKEEDAKLLAEHAKGHGAAHLAREFE